MVMQDADIAAITLLLSPERLGNLYSLTGNTRAAIELHQETLILGAELMSIIATIEIGLRNTVSENLSRHFRTADWLISPPTPFRWRDSEARKIASAHDNARRSEYSKLNSQERSNLDTLAYPSGRPQNESHLNRAKKRRRQINVSNGKIIAEITFHFWKKIYGSEYEHSLWKPTLKKTFPHKSVKRSDVAIHLENIYQARNRLAHHEPVLHNRFETTLSSIDYIIQRLGVSNIGENTPLSNLLLEPMNSLKDNAKSLHEKLAAYRQQS